MLFFSPFLLLNEVELFSKHLTKEHLVLIKQCVVCECVCYASKCLCTLTTGGYMCTCACTYVHVQGALKRAGLKMYVCCYQRDRQDQFGLSVMEGGDQDAWSLRGSGMTNDLQEVIALFVLQNLSDAEGSSSHLVGVQFLPLRQKSMSCCAGSSDND